MRVTHKLSSNVALASAISPVSQSAGAVNGTAIDMQRYERVLYILQTGTLGASATVDYSVKSDSASGGSYSNTVRSLTQVVKASGDSKQAMIEVRASDLPAGHRYVRDTLTVGTAASLVAAIALAYGARFDPASDYNPAAVLQIAA